MNKALKALAKAEALGMQQTVQNNTNVPEWLKIFEKRVTGPRVSFQAVFRHRKAFLVFEFCDEKSITFAHSYDTQVTAIGQNTPLKAYYDEECNTFMAPF